MKTKFDPETTSARSDVQELSQRNGDGWLMFLYGLLLRLIPLVELPREEEPWSDLYVMF